jgi:3-ketosteroid 9alpha-monooxygenase subunit B
MAKTDQSTPVDPLSEHPHHEYHHLRVEKVVDETADACSIIFEIPEDVAATFRYKAGQFLTLKIPYQGKSLVRCYSLASSPDCDSEHKVTVKRIDDGRISNWINDNLAKGDVVEVLPPGGLFTLSDGDNPLLLFAGGSGITPVISLIKSALATTARTIKLVYANRNASSIIFEDELASLVDSHDGRLEVVHSLDDVDGFLDVEAVAGHLAGHGNAEVYVCGPSAFMGVVEQALQAEGVGEQQIHIEKFVSPPDPDDAAAEHAEEAAALAGDECPEFITVELDGQTRQVPYQKGQTVLVSCQRTALEPPFSCTDGFCGCCMAKLTAGEVRMINNDFLSAKEVSEGWVLTCQSVPVTRECSVKYPD